MRSLLMEMLSHRKDRIALDIIREHPELVDERIIGLALDNGCVRVIRYLREHDLITAEGAAERDHRRMREHQRLLDELDAVIPDLEKFFEP